MLTFGIGRKRAFNDIGDSSLFSLGEPMCQVAGLRTPHTELGLNHPQDLRAMCHLDGK
tara:strand:+ start:902 stop:1075 length:174 start_codon:yes stop_codon:yes gene_type:complete